MIVLDRPPSGFDIATASAKRRGTLIRQLHPSGPAGMQVPTRAKVGMIVLDRPPSGFDIVADSAKRRGTLFQQLHPADLRGRRSLPEPR